MREVWLDGDKEAFRKARAIPVPPLTALEAQFGS